MIPVGISQRALREGEVVRHGEGIITHTTPNEDEVGELMDAVNTYIVGEDVDGAGMLMVYRGRAGGGRIYLASSLHLT